MKALIAMSGGVDSSVAAILTEEYDRIGCTMRLYDGEEESSCCSLQDVEDARAVCHRLQIPFYVFNFTSDFCHRIIEPFIDSYRRGMTPNPCIECNRHMKFERLLDRARELGCDVVVTGHYARVEHTGDRYILRKAADPSKDQSYVLYTLTQAQLAHIRFPLGAYTKDAVRRIAAEHGFVNASKPDSQDICFVPDGDYAAFIERTVGAAPTGDFITPEGEVVGTHRGIIHYTLGQRKHLGLSMGRPVFVTDIDPAHNTVTVGDEAYLFSRTATVGDFNWISGDVPTSPIRCRAKTRYRQTEQPCTAAPQPDGSVILTFDDPIRAITPGQSAVLYDGDIVLGGGIILSSQRD